MERYGLVLEGGGLRGAYTAGALAWLNDHNIEFDYAAGISSGAVYLACYEMKNKDVPYLMATRYACAKENVGIIPLLREHHYVAYEKIFRDDLIGKAGLDTKPLLELKPDMEIGAYDLNKGETIWYGPETVGRDMTLLRAACALPIASARVPFDGTILLDGGITKMIPIERAIEKKCTKFLVITTKGADYVRKPSSKMVLFMMRIFYHEYPKLREDYAVRQENYYKQMGIINDLVEKGDAILMRPTQNIKSSRYKGEPENMEKLYALGYQDMEDRKEELLTFLGRK